MHGDGEAARQQGRRVVASIVCLHPPRRNPWLPMTMPRGAAWPRRFARGHSRSLPTRHSRNQTPAGGRIFVVLSKILWVRDYLSRCPVKVARASRETHGSLNPPLSWRRTGSHGGGIEPGRWTRDRRFTGTAARRAAAGGVASQAPRMPMRKPLRRISRHPRTGLNSRCAQSSIVSESALPSLPWTLPPMRNALNLSGGSGGIQRRRTHPRRQDGGPATAVPRRVHAGVSAGTGPGAAPDGDAVALRQTRDGNVHIGPAPALPLPSLWMARQDGIRARHQASPPIAAQ